MTATADQSDLCGRSSDPSKCCCGQSDVQRILRLLGYQQLRVTSLQTGGMPGGSSLLSTEEVLSAINVSETLNPVCSSWGVVSNAELQEPLTREFASVNSATSSSADAECPSTKEYCVNEKPVSSHLNLLPAFSNNDVSILLFILTLSWNGRTRVH